MLVKYWQSVCALVPAGDGAALAPPEVEARCPGTFPASPRRGTRGENTLMNRRMARLFVFLFAVVFALAAPAAAQTSAPAELWSGIIASSRAIDWSHAGLPPMLPDGETTLNTYTPPVRTRVCASIAPEGSPGSPVAQTDINAAIANCAPGGVVYLEAGSFYISNGIDFAGTDDVTLRGAGADQTLLHFTGGTGCQGYWATICVPNDERSYDNANPQFTASWTAGYSRGTTQVTLSSTADITPGKTLLTLDQQDGPLFDPGGLWVCETPGICSDQGNGGSVRPGRAQQQVVLATAVSGNTVTISPGLYLSNWSASQNPGAWWAAVNVSGDGVEDLSVDATAAANAKAGILIANGYGNWVDGVRVLNTARSHVWIINSAHNLVANSYFYGTLNAAQESYGVEENGGSDDLIINNIFQHIVAGILMSGPSSGTVVAYNYGLDDYFSPSSTVMMSEFQAHNAGIAMDLVEGNVMDSFNADDAHGTQNLLSFFRNRFYGEDPADPGRTVDTVAFDDTSFHRYFNVVGNVLGTAGFSDTYQAVGHDEVLLGGIDKTIFTIGDTFVSDFEADDSVSTSSLLRWGNYDTVHGATQWNPSEVPSGLQATAGYQQALIGAGDGPYTAALANCSSTSPAIANNVTVEANGEEQAYDNGSGLLVSSGVAYDGSLPNAQANFDFSLGTVNYTGCTVTVTFLSPPSNPTVQYLQATGAASPFQNPLPPTETLPASFFLSSKPAFWVTAFGNPPWPAIGPDVSGGPGPTGHHYAIPAELCYQNAANDPGYAQDTSGLYVKIFNAGKCYGQPPAAPTSLAATVE